MTDRSTQDTVRDFELTLEDSARLAECFNSFDDSDSWPGGFTGGNLYTAERIFEERKKSSDIRVLVAYDGDKIVGYCNVCPGELDTEAAYVGLLGVDPTYQGKGYGKYLLIEAAETVARVGMRRIDLHTWGGNLKAMPLYKRTGYSWVPGTRVLMESHIPGIIGAPLFKRFFERHFWYDSFKTKVTQEVDDIVEEKIGVFKYHFEGENGDSLDVSVDREAKGICGFTLKFDGKILSASVRPKTHVGYIGLNQYPFEFKISNGLDSGLSYSLNVSPTDSLKIELQGELSGTLGSSDEISLDGIYSIPVGVRSIDREDNADEKVHSQAEFSLTLDGMRIDLFSGLSPQDAITLSCGPQFPVFSPGQKRTFGLGVRNNTDTLYTCEIVLSADERYGLSNGSIRLDIKSGELIEHPLEMHIEHDEPEGTIPIEISLYVIDEDGKHLIKTTTLNVGVIGIVGAIAYKSIDEYYVLETETYRLLISANPPMAVRRIDNKVLGVQMPAYGGLLPDIGYPFSSGGTEWDRKKFEVELETTTEFAEIRMRAKSSGREGLELTVKFRARVGTEFVEMTTELHNHSTTALQNLGVKVGGWSEFRGDTLVVPTQGDIREFKSVEWGGGRVLSKTPKDYHEQWFASFSESHGLRGIIWNGRYAESIRMRRSWSFPRLEYKIPDIDPGQRFSFSLLKLIISDGSWQKVRDLWARTTSTTIQTADPVELRTDLEIGIVPADSPEGRIPESAMLIDRTKENNLQLRIQTLRVMKFSGTVSLKLPEGIVANGLSEITADIENISYDDPFILPLTVDADDDTKWLRKGGEISIRFKSRNIRMDLVAVVYDPEVTVSQDIEELEGKHLHTATCSGFTMAVSPDYTANLVRYGRAGGKSIFYDTFPKAGPFVWHDKHFSGMHPRLIGAGVWDWQTALPKETWDVENVESGPWVGYKMQTILRHCPQLKGMDISIRYMILKGTPVVFTEIRARNKTGQWHRINFGFQGVPRPGGKHQPSVYCTKGGERVQFDSPEVDVDIFPDASEGWIAYHDPESKETLGFIAISKARSIIQFNNIGPAGQWLVVRDSRNLKVDEESAISGYYIITDDPEDVSALKSLGPPST